MNGVFATAYKNAAVLGRIVWKAGKSAGASSAELTIPAGAGGSTDVIALRNKVFVVGTNPDLLLASLYQSNDATSGASTSSTGSKWCIGAWSNSLSSNVSVKIMKGLNVNTKCTF